MDLGPTDEQQAIIEALRDFSEKEIRPAARDCEESGQVSDGISRQLREMGITAPVGEEFGGQGVFDSLTSVMVAEEIAWGDPGVAFSVLSAGLPATVIDLIGTDSQRKELLPQFVDGALGFLALAERDAGADISEIDAEFKDGSVTGLKYGVIHADTAAVRLVVAKDGEHPAVFIVPSSAELTAKPEDKMGLRAARTFKVNFDGVSGAERLGDGDGEATLKALLRAKLVNAGIAVGLGRAALEYASDYAKERTAFGRPIGAFQGISFKIADRAMDVETARLMLWRAAWALENDKPEATKAVMQACSHAIVAAATSSDDGVQILGGHGYMRDHPEELWYRDALTLATFDSPSMVGDLFLASYFKAG
jgi:alkylation response protein AidB-like acyl-CoA dehydrogenase